MQDFRRLEIWLRGDDLNRKSNRIITSFLGTIATGPSRLLRFRSSKLFDVEVDYSLGVTILKRKFS